MIDRTNSKRRITIWVPGLPQPGESETGQAVVQEEEKWSAQWRASVASEASKAFKSPWAGDLEIYFFFFFVRPQSHFGKGGELLAFAPNRPSVPPGVPKLVRATEDALTGIAWLKDAQVVWQHAGKGYGEKAGATIKIVELD